METQAFGWLLAQLPQLTARQCAQVPAQPQFAPFPWGRHALPAELPWLALRT